MEYILKPSVYLMKLIPILNINVKFISLKCQFVPEESTMIFIYLFIFLVNMYI